MEEEKILQEIGSIKESISELTKALNDNLERGQNSVAWEVGERRVNLVSTSKNVEELLHMAKVALETYKDK